MIEFLHEAGFGVWPVLALGVFALALAIRHVTRPRPEHTPLIAGASVATLLMGALGTVTGLQRSVEYAARLPATDHFVVLVGLRESLNNLVAAFVAVTLVVIIASLGSFRAARIARSVSPTPHA